MYMSDLCRFKVRKGITFRTVCGETDFAVSDRPDETPSSKHCFGHAGFNEQAATEASGSEEEKPVPEVGTTDAQNETTQGQGANVNATPHVDNGDPDDFLTVDKELTTTALSFDNELTTTALSELTMN
jgi:hypothetical protein